MPLAGPALRALVYIDHLATFPTAVNAVRENPNTGVPRHNIPLTFIGALCDAYATSLKAMTITDLGTGVIGVPPGTAVPALITFPGAIPAAGTFLLSQGWTGPQGALVARSYISQVLNRAAQISLLHMRPNSLMAIGAGVVSPASNPGLFAAMQTSLNTELPRAFQATGKFCEGDVPGAPLNSILAEQLPRYATALATGTATMIGAVVYAGTAGPTTPVTLAPNTGSIQ